MAAIDRVHGDGDLPTIPILLVPHLLDDRGRTRDAVFVYHRLDPSQPFIASIIFVRSSAAHRPFVATHEIGHFLDLCGLPGSTFASSEEPALAEWRKSVIESSAYRSLGTLTRSLDATVANRANELTVLEELWARSYAQFVATRSGSLPMQRTLAALRHRDPHTLYYPRQWDDDDFVAVEAALDNLFRGLGWIA
ncbi:MAG TPA: hypothetical protein VKB09_13150 [Thermomicrobiales bacterium]|nr:hypothetical protein [Thermomicrobiales bacterium]